MAMALHTLADHLAFENVEGCEQGGGAMSLVVVREGCGAALLHRQAGLSSVERLDLALLGCRPRPANWRGDAVVERHRRHAALGFAALPLQRVVRVIRWSAA